MVLQYQTYFRMQELETKSILDRWAHLKVSNIRKSERTIGIYNMRKPADRSEEQKPTGIKNAFVKFM